MVIMGNWLADTAAIAAVTSRRPATIRSWARRYPESLPRHGTGDRGRALYDIRDAEKLATQLDARHLENALTMCNTETPARACPETGG